MSHAQAAETLLDNGEPGGKPSDAQAALALVEAQLAVSLAPDNVGIQVTLGNALSELHREAEARAAYQHALMLAQTNYPEFQSDWLPGLKRMLR